MKQKNNISLEKNNSQQNNFAKDMSNKNNSNIKVYRKVSNNNHINDPYQNKVKINNPYESNINIHAKLSVSQPDDPAELEADRISENIMNDNISQINVDRKIQTKNNSSNGLSISGDLASDISSLSGGQPLSDSEQSFYASKIGSDFSNVKIHNDNKAHDMADSLNAKAFTYGNNIVFNKGEYQPGTTDGKKLMAHELVHTVQQVNNDKNILKKSRESFEGGINENVFIKPNILYKLNFKDPLKAQFRNLGELEFTTITYTIDRNKFALYHSNNRRRKSAYSTSKKTRIEKLLVGNKKQWSIVFNDANKSISESHIKLFLLAALGKSYYFNKNATNCRLKDSAISQKTTVINNITTSKLTYLTKNTISSKPTEEECMDFMHALYKSDGKLKLSAGPWQSLLGKFIEKYQPIYLNMINNINNIKSSSINGNDINNFTNKASTSVKYYMIASGFQSAMEAVQMYMESKYLKITSRKADYLMINAATIIKSTFKSIDSDSKANTDLKNVVIKTITDFLGTSKHFMRYAIKKIINRLIKRNLKKNRRSYRYDFLIFLKDLENTTPEKIFSSKEVRSFYDSFDIGR